MRAERVYVETCHAGDGRVRFDPQLGVGQPEGTYGVAIYDVAQGAFIRSFGLGAPWCGVGELFAFADGRLAVLCTAPSGTRCGSSIHA